MGTRRPDCPEYYPHSINNTKGPKFPDCFACECYTEMELTPGNPYERELKQMDMVTATSLALRVMYENEQQGKAAAKAREKLAAQTFYQSWDRGKPQRSWYDSFLDWFRSC